MADEPSTREPIVSEGRYAVIDTDEEGTGYRLVATATDGATDADGDRRGVRIEDGTIDDLAAVVDRLRGLRTDAGDSADAVELTCHECGKTWTYTGSDDHAACPNCETEVPREGVGP